MTDAYSYIRFSTPAQLSGDSLRRQLQLSEEFTEKHGLTLDTSLTLRDLGLSAYHKINLTHGALGVFLEAVKEGRVKPGSYLIVESLDRLSRAQVLDHLQIFISILNAGIVIATLADGQIYSRESVRDNFTQLIISITIMSRAHEESAMKSRRIKSAWDNRRTTENLQGKLLTKNCPTWLKVSSKNDQRFEIILERAAVIKTIFRWCSQGIGVHTISKKLMAAGVNSPKGCKIWQPASVNHLLRNRAVLGEYQPRERDKAWTGIAAKYVAMGEPIMDYYPQIIDHELFSIAQQATYQNLTVRGRKTDTSGGYTSLFSGLLKCGYCGGRMAFLGTNKKMVGGEVKSYRYLVCDAFKRGGEGACESTKWEYTQFEERFLQYCRELDVRGLLDGEVDRSEVQSLSFLLDGKKALQIETELKITRLVDAMADGELIDVLRPRIKKLQSESVALEDEVKSLLKQFNSLSMSTVRMEQSKAELTGLLDKLDDPEIRMLVAGQLRKLVTGIDLYTGGESLPFVPDKKKRFFAVWFKNGAYRIVQEGGHDGTSVVLADEGAGSFKGSHQ